MIDLVITGPDMSGSSTQLNCIISHLESQGKKVRELGKRYLDALFHADEFRLFNEYVRSLSQFNEVYGQKDLEFLVSKLALAMGGYGEVKERPPSMVKNDITTYINPDSADAWVLEEPPLRGAGHHNRYTQNYARKFGVEQDPVAAAQAHSIYRIDEFINFRKPLREAGKIILRSRSEESTAAYQMGDKDFPQGIDRSECLSLPGHKVAFGNPPTHIFIVCAPETWTEKDYIRMREQRQGSRNLDTYEKDAALQIRVNKRYASKWIEDVYYEACSMYGSQMPQFTRFNIYDSRENNVSQMIKKFEEIRKDLSTSKP